MDALAIFLKLVREAVEASGAPPDAFQEALISAEARARSALGGSHHHISRWPAVSTKARVIELAQQKLPNAVIAERLGVTDRYVRRIVSQLRIVSHDR
jgi:methylphosphotriester-DNA--protein-cysteine methyltransferase